MKKYPKIYHYNQGKFGEYCYAFDKIDGSNIRVEWDMKLSKKSTSTLGFKKFGTRTRVITNMNHPMSDSVNIFMDKYAENLDKIFREDKYFRSIKRIMVYLEYFGENSFAGTHDKNEEKDLILFDIERFQKGFMEPNEFIKKFSMLGIPEIIYEGEYNQNLIDNIKNDIDLKEGVVCKGSSNKEVWMAKIKTDKWIKDVKEKFGTGFVEEDFNYDENLIKDFKGTT
jgi:hypothetical protein